MRGVAILLIGLLLGAPASGGDPGPDTATEIAPETPAEPEESEAPSEFEEILFGGPPSVSERLQEEEEGEASRFALIAHHPTYLMPFTWNFEADDASFAEFGAPIKPQEITLQISLKVPVLKEPFGAGSQLTAGYTQRAFWQAYNGEVSRPFRETNHEPELMLDFVTDYRLFGFTNRVVRFGANHQSNGRSDPYSRSWNRLYAEFLLERGGFAISLKPWARIPESSSDDDNPDIRDYLGHGELRIGWRRGDNNYTAMFRNYLESDFEYGAFQLTWSYGMSRGLRGYVQLFTGYGESLIDYNRRVTRIGFGVQLTDWL